MIEGTSERAETKAGARRTRRCRSVFGVGSAVLVLALLTSCGLPAEEQRLLDRTNQTRREVGRPALANDGTLNDKAERHAADMARQGRLFHTDLRQGVPPGWRHLAENVAVGSSVDSAYDQFGRSQGHYNNIIDTRSTRIGVGVVRGPDGRYWIVQVFWG